jgi:hypothetical protein
MALPGFFSGGQPPVSVYAVRLRGNRPAYLPAKSHAQRGAPAFHIRCRFGRSESSNVGEIQ